MVRARLQVWLGREQRCPMCRDGLDQDVSRLTVCRSCRTVYHAECMQELARGCTTLGCDRNVRVQRPAARPTPPAFGGPTPSTLAEPVRCRPAALARPCDRVPRTEVQLVVGMIAGLVLAFPFLWLLSSPPAQPAQRLQPTWRAR